MSTFSLPSDTEEIAKRVTTAAMDFSGKTVLMTGGRGFLGRHFMDTFNYLNEHILPEPMKLVVLDNFISSGKEGKNIPKFPHVEFIEHNVINKFEYSGKIDYIIHAAGIASPFYYRAHPIETLEVAITGTKNMLQLAEANNARFTFFSSSEVYGDPDAKHVPMQESYRGNVSSMGPRACYDESKRVGETLCYIFHENNGVHTNVIRPFNVYGPGMQETDYRVLPNFASRIKSGMPLHVYGSGGQTRTFCYLTDAIVGFLLVFLRGVAGEVYNIGNPKPEITILELVKRVETVLGKKVNHEVIEYPDSYPADEPLRRAPDIRKAKIQLEYTPEVSLEDGLKRFLDWSDKTYTGDA
ncbi:MAG: NAD-dependent epimerase/dehydratase family protein [Rhodospirillaceae bacterium]|nr:NAD-dependent epimerase/dehydratase family protein [Rhodospirillaceae bacterium]